jgi:hypothetical protein
MAKAKAPKEGGLLHWKPNKKRKSERTQPKNLKRKPSRGQGKP